MKCEGNLCRDGLGTGGDARIDRQVQGDDAVGAFGEQVFLQTDAVRGRVPHTSEPTARKE